jgi:hypothetical protein
MIEDLDETIKKLLVEGIPLDTSEVDVSFEAPNSEWKSGLSRPTINCYLYHVVENHELRRTDWELNRVAQIEANGKHVASRHRVPFRMDFSYMVTTWANEVEDEHRLLWRALAALIKYQKIPHELLQGNLPDTQDWPVPIKVAQPDAVFKNPADFWTGMEVYVKPGINVVVTLALDPNLYFDIPLVLTRRVRVYPDIRAEKGGEELPTVQFGGWVFRGLEAQAGRVPGAQVVIVEKNLSTVTDSYGRFKFDHVPHGRYTLRAIFDGSVGERQISVPGTEYDLVLSERQAPLHQGQQEQQERQGGSGEAGAPPDSPQSGRGRRR